MMRVGQFNGCSKQRPDFKQRPDLGEFPWANFLGELFFKIASKVEPLALVHVALR